MKNLFITLFSIVLVVSCSAPKNDSQNPKIHKKTENIISESEQTEGWQLLFDGKTFNGWRGIGIDSVPKGHWEIIDGTIHKIASGNVPTLPDGQPLKGGDLMTDKTFKNFELSFEWKISKAGNSGVKYNVSEKVSIDKGTSHALGYEYQVLDDKNHNDNLNPTHRAASLYDLIEAKDKTLKPVGEFNSGRIIFNNNHLEHWLNGKKVVEADTDSPKFQQLFEKSKYKNYPNFTVHKDAHIVLQDHGDDCWYRNIKIKLLK